MFCPMFFQYEIGDRLKEAVLALGYLISSLERSRNLQVFHLFF